MDIQHIPKTFWHALSIAVLVVSGGLAYVAYRSSTVSIELANAKVNLSSEVASSTIALKSALDEAKDAKAEAEKKYSELFKQHELLQLKLEQLESHDTQNSLPAGPFGSFKSIREICPDCLDLPPLEPTLPFTDFDQNINDAQISLKKLESLGKQIQTIR